MYPVTHITIAVGSVCLGTHLARKAQRWVRAPALTTNAPSARDDLGEERSFDYRLVALGALVPDLIDKPLKWVLFPDQLPDGHVYGHTLLLPCLLIAAGLLFARRGDTRLLAIGLGCLTHPLIDPVVRYPRTLFWPLLGTEFPEARSIIAPIQKALEVMVIAGYAGLLWRRPALRDWARKFATTGRLKFG